MKVCSTHGWEIPPARGETPAWGTAALRAFPRQSSVPWYRAGGPVD